MRDRLLVTAQWDDEAAVWVATSDDIPGLVTEAATLDDLLRRVQAIAPELLDDNAHLHGEPRHPAEVLDVHIVSQLRGPSAYAH